MKLRKESFFAVEEPTPPSPPVGLNLFQVSGENVSIRFFSIIRVPMNVTHFLQIFLG